MLEFKEKKDVFEREVFKSDSEDACLMCSGRSFHRKSFFLGTFRSSVSADLRDRLGL